MKLKPLQITVLKVLVERARNSRTPADRAAAIEYAAKVTKISYDGAAKILSAAPFHIAPADRSSIGATLVRETKVDTTPSKQLAPTLMTMSTAMEAFN